jgi:AraC-like DNA-binding protein
LVKKETGHTTKEFIQNKLIDTAKTKFFESEKTVNKIAYKQGFKYSQHFSRLFKDKVGVLPSEFSGFN